MEAADHLHPVALIDPAPSSSSWRKTAENSSSLSKNPLSNPSTQPCFTVPSEHIEQNFQATPSSHTISVDSKAELQASHLPSTQHIPVANTTPSVPQPTNVHVTTPTSVPLSIPSPAATVDPPRRSTHQTKPTQHFSTVNLAPASHFSHFFTAMQCPYQPKQPQVDAKSVHVCLEGEDVLHSILAAKKKTDPDLFTFDRVMASEDQELWIAPAEKELIEPQAHDVWIEVPLHSVKGQVIPSAWVFHVKRGPDGTINPRKGWICLCGDLTLTHQLLHFPQSDSSLLSQSFSNRRPAPLTSQMP